MGGHFERNIFNWWADADFSLGRPEPWGAPLLMLDADAALIASEDTAFRAHVLNFADDALAFHTTFQAAFVKMSELGVACATGAAAAGRSLEHADVSTKGSGGMLPLASAAILAASLALAGVLAAVKVRASRMDTLVQEDEQNVQSLLKSGDSANIDV